MDFHSGPLDPGSPDGDPRFGGSNPGSGDSGGGVGEEGPFHPWLPPEDRLWRHPSEGAPVIRPDAMHEDRGHRGGAADRHDRLTTTLGAVGLANWRTTCAIAVIAGLVGAAAVSGMAFAGGWWHQTTVVRPFLQSSSVLSNGNDGLTADWTEVDEMVSPSVVGITVDSPAGPQDGSGVLISAGTGGEAYIVTDYSLVYPSIAANTKPSIQVSFLSGTAPGVVIGYDAISRLVLIGATDPGHPTPASTASVAYLDDLQPVLALGDRSYASLATGEVAGQDRTVNLPDGSDVDNLIQVSMPEASDVAGGPLVNQSGEVVGITLALQPLDTSQQQSTFAEPIDVVKSSVTQILEGKSPVHAWLGVADAEDIPSASAHQMGASSGVTVGYVTLGSPASRAGIDPGDVLTSFDDKPLLSAGEFVAMLAKCVPNDSAQISWVHDGIIRSTTVVLRDEPNDAP